MDRRSFGERPSTGRHGSATPGRRRWSIHRHLSEGVARVRQGISGRPLPIIATAEFVHPMRPIHEAQKERVHVAGTPQEMITTFRAYEAAGLDHLICHFVADNMDEQLSQMRLFSEEVMPEFVE